MNGGNNKRLRQPRDAMRLGAFYLARCRSYDRGGKRVLAGP